MKSVRPWFTFLIGTDISTPLGLTPMPKIGVCYYDSGYKHQSTFRIHSLHCRQPGQGPASPPLDISYLGFERARQLHAEGLRPAPDGMVASLLPDVGLVSPMYREFLPCAALPPLAPEQRCEHIQVQILASTVQSHSVCVRLVCVTAPDLYPSQPPSAPCVLGDGANLPLHVVLPAAACTLEHASLSRMSMSCVSLVSPDHSVECARPTSTSSVARVACPAADVYVRNACHFACPTEQRNAQLLSCPVGVPASVQYCRYLAGSSSLPRKSDVLRGTAGGDVVCLSEETPSGAACNLGAGSPTGVILHHPFLPMSSVFSHVPSTCRELNVCECDELHSACEVALSTTKAEQRNALPVPVLSCSHLSCVGIRQNDVNVPMCIPSVSEVVPPAQAPLPRTPFHGGRLECKFLRQGPVLAPIGESLRTSM